MWEKVYIYKFSKIKDAFLHKEQCQLYTPGRRVLMHPQEFEKKFFELVFRTNIKLTPHLIAYRLGLPFQEVKQHLDKMAHQNIVSLEVDASGVITYEVPGADRPARDWMATSPEAAAVVKLPETKEMGKWFSGPAAEEPPKPVYIEPEDEAVFVASQRSWLWVPLLLIFSLFLLPFVFGLLFFCVSDTSGFGLFFLLSVVLLKVACGAGSCVETSRGCRRSISRR
jgi:hypothetical protein